MISIALHGGAGDRNRDTLSPEREEEYTRTITEAMDRGYAVLEAGGSSIDAVETAIRILEDATCYNSGRGAALNSLGKAELDAGIFDGATMHSGAVAGVLRVRCPIAAARYIMEHTPQVLFIGEHAEAVAERGGLEMVDNSFFITDEVRALYEQGLRAREAAAAEAAAAGAASSNTEEKVILGTVGCVALDAHGHMAAGNSTGGIMHKPAGRVGDTPLAGAGMYAMDGVGAVACTGHGEFFVRTVAAHDVIARMRYAGASIATAMDAVLADISRLGGRGGMIGIDAKGTIHLPFSTSSMVRAGRNAAGVRVVEVW
ncbi:MAG: isoaspartyl peptidase/L-asparaginase family protein [Candidatus Kapaibacterium sp.]